MRPNHGATVDYKKAETSTVLWISGINLVKEMLKLKHLDLDVSILFLVSQRTLQKIRSVIYIKKKLVKVLNPVSKLFFQLSSRGLLV